MVIGLKPCPFCGASGARLLDTRDGVVCLDCDTMGPAADSSSEAAARWNRRDPFADLPVDSTKETGSDE